MFDDAAIEFPPLTSVVVASLSATVRLYPKTLFEFTVTVWLVLVSVPLEVGVTLIDGAVPVARLITDWTVAVTVVFVLWVAADASAGESAMASAAIPSATCLISGRVKISLMLFFLFCLSLFLSIF